MLALIFNKTILRYVFIVVCLYLSQACLRPPAEQTKAHSIFNKNLTDTAVYQQKTVYESSPYLTENEGQLDTSFVKITYPEFKDSILNGIVTDAMLLEGETNIQHYVNNFIESYGNFIEENDIQYPIAWSKETNVDVQVLTPEIISIRNRTYEFTGGAHGNYFELWSNYSLQDYKKLDLNRFISEDKIKDFTKIAEKIFRNQEGLQDTSNLERDYFFENGKFALAANYGFLKKGIAFFYNTYEIKPYSAGPTQLIVPYEQVEHILTNTGKQYVKHIKDFYQTIN